MISNSVEMGLAEHLLKRFSGFTPSLNEDEQWKEDHRDAMECRDCEEFIQLGISTFERIRNTELTLRAADSEGYQLLSAETLESLFEMYRTWIITCDKVEKWILSLQGRQFHVELVSELATARAEVESLVEDYDWSRLSLKNLQASFD